MESNSLFVLDLDRTLTEDKAVGRVLLGVCKILGFDYEALKNTQASTEARGESFFVLEYLHDSLPDGVTTNDVEETFKHVARSEPILYDDVLPFLDSLKSRSIPVLILTYGEHSWQTLKLEASDLHENPYIITDQKVKGSLIEAWHTAGGYMPTNMQPQAPFKAIILVDDKAMSFENLPIDCTGYLIRRPDEVVLPSQAGSTPDNVKVVPNLMSILKELDELIGSRSV